MDIVERFFHQLNGTQPADVKPLTLVEQQQIHDRLRAFSGGLPLEQIPPELQEALLGKRQLALPVLMLRCAEALERHPALATALQVQPASMRTLGNQDLNLGGLIKLLEIIHQGAHDRGLECGQRADRLISAARDAAAAELKDPATDFSRRSQLGALFEEATRFSMAAQASAQTQGQPLESLQDQLAQTHDGPTTARAIEELIALAHATAPAAPTLSARASSKAHQ